MTFSFLFKCAYALPTSFDKKGEIVSSCFTSDRASKTLSVDLLAGFNLISISESGSSYCSCSRIILKRVVGASKKHGVTSKSTIYSSSNGKL